MAETDGYSSQRVVLESVYDETKALLDDALAALKGWTAWEEAQELYSAECDRIRADATTMSMLAHYPNRVRDSAVILRDEVLAHPIPVVPG